MYKILAYVYVVSVCLGPVTSATHWENGWRSKPFISCKPITTTSLWRMHVCRCQTSLAISCIVLALQYLLVVQFKWLGPIQGLHLTLECCSCLSLIVVTTSVHFLKLKYDWAPICFVWVYVSLCNVCTFACMVECLTSSYTSDCKKKKDNSMTWPSWLFLSYAPACVWAYPTASRTTSPGIETTWRFCEPPLQRNAP